MVKVVYEGELSSDDVQAEDGGAALIWEPGQVSLPYEEHGMFVRLQSRDDSKNHDLFNKFVGRRVRITVEYSSPLEQLAELAW